MKKFPLLWLATLMLSGLVSASDSSFNFAISGLDVPILNPENGEPSISMVYLEADFTMHARSIGLNGFLNSTDGCDSPLAIEWCVLLVLI